MWFHEFNQNDWKIMLKQQVQIKHYHFATLITNHISIQICLQAWAHCVYTVQKTCPNLNSNHWLDSFCSPFLINWNQFEMLGTFQLNVVFPFVFYFYIIEFSEWMQQKVHWTLNGERCTLSALISSTLAFLHISLLSHKNTVPKHKKKTLSYRNDVNGECCWIIVSVLSYSVCSA